MRNTQTGTAVRRRPSRPWCLALSHLLLCASLASSDDSAAIEARLAAAAKYLASDQLEGRGVGTEGLDLAAAFIADQFQEIGLKTDLFDGQPYQGFQVTTTSKPGKQNSLRFVGPLAEPGGPTQTIELRFEEDFTPMSIGGSGDLDLPVVFVGYGITAKEAKYDDYANIDASGKAVVIVRHEPQQDDPESALNGTKDSQYAPFRRKVSNAFEHGAAAVIFCTDQYEIGQQVLQLRKKWVQALDELVAEYAEFKSVEDPTLQQVEAQRKRIGELTDQAQTWSKRLEEAYDPVLPFGAGGRDSQGRDFPVVHCRRAPLDRLLKAAVETDLATLEARIDRGPTPQSRVLDGWRLVGKVQVERTQTEVKNVAGLLEGRGPLAHEALVIGAHYDHLGRGGTGSLSPNEQAVHNGADDNASGVAVMLEVARALAEEDSPARRTVVFVAFTGEERGLLGSGHYVGDPLVPNEKTVAMLNLDMVGHLRDDKLIVYGSGTATQLEGLLDRVNQRHGFQLAKKPGGFGPSDQSSFYARKVPVLHFFTGTHRHYHRPSDDFEHLNLTGMRRITNMVTELASSLATKSDRPKYVATASTTSRAAGDRPYFGTIPDFASQTRGYALSGVSPGGPAERAGLKSGDVIIQFGDSRIGNLADFDSALRKHEGGDRVQTKVLRNGQEQVFEVTLDPPR